MIKIRYILGVITMILLVSSVMAQQKDIPRITAMPDKPAAYTPFDWKKLAKDYDKFVFDISATGEHLPLTTISTEDGVNYPEVRDIYMTTFVGQESKTIAEAINIIPSIVGASLIGIDKSDQNNINWVEKAKEFFNKKNGQNVYLNNYSAGTGGDWWYELMPNVYFYQLYDLYPQGTSEFGDQFVTVANRQLDVVYQLGGSVSPWQYPDMNYRAFNLETGKANGDGVKEPEAAGSIAWILYQAYLKNGDDKYRLGAELSLDFLQAYQSNPSYEIQLPYGILTAARLNAEQGTEYDIDKFLNWTFSDGANTLRGWGTIVGNWGGYDVSGLIGEASEAGNDYAFLMNGFQHAAALTPVAKYDKRYAKAIGKWLLNLSNASRLFYPRGLPEANQEAVSLAWSKQYDLQSCVPYEAIKQNKDGVSPYATGDALAGGWSATNLSLYSGAGVGYLAAIVEPTDVDGILQIDLNKTDFGTKGQLSQYLYYNPNGQDELVTVNLPSGQYAIYDAITETTLLSSVSGSTQINVPSKDVRLLVIYPADKTTKQSGRTLVLDSGEVLDYHYQWNYTPVLRIKSLYTASSEILTGEQVVIEVLADNASTATYEWYVDGIKQAVDEVKWKWTAPSDEKVYTIKCVVRSGQMEVSEEINIEVISAFSVAPEIKGINLSGANPYALASVVTVSAETNSSASTIEWICSAGSLSDATSLTPQWTLPDAEGVYTLELKLTNSKGTASHTVQVLVKDIDEQTTFTPVIYYPLDGDTRNFAQDKLHATLAGNATLVNDPQGEAERAYRFENGDQYIYTPNSSDLNFQDQMTLSFWVKPEKIGEGEQFIISHGSWEERYKASLLPEGKLRFTLNTTDRIADIDDPTPLENGIYVHYTCVFTGYSVEIYRAGKLVSFAALGGSIHKSTKYFTIARKDESTKDYSFIGAIDEVRLYDVALDVATINTLPTQFESVASNSIEIKNLWIDGVKWPNVGQKYILDCGSGASSILVEVEAFSGSVVDKSTITVDVSKAGIHDVAFSITTADGSKSQSFVLQIEKSFQGEELVSQKWNKVLTVNNNSTTNGGFTFTGYQWTKNGANVGVKQYYSVGNGDDDVLNPDDIYSIILSMEGGQTINVCPFSPQSQIVSSISVYPNPVAVGEPVCIEANVNPEILATARVDVYTVTGLFVKSMKLEEIKSYFELHQSGLHILKYVAEDGMQKSFKILVK